MTTHPRKLLLTLLLCLLCVVLALQNGEVKPWARIDWFDVLGEGSSFLVVLAWLLLVLFSRPAGPVTNGLYVGSLLLVLSYWLNLLDEFIAYPDTERLLSWLESIPAPIGMLVLTMGLVGWHREQRLINSQLTSRELHLRAHDLLDPLTRLYRRNYLLQALRREQALQAEHQQPFCLWLLELDELTQLMQQQGLAESEHRLQQLAELLLLQFRPGDLVCRLSSHSFVVLLPETPERTARVLTDLALRHLGSTMQLQARRSALHCQTDAYPQTAEALLHQLQQQLPPVHQAALLDPH
ncbi:GGDEF domain-containing protein [Rheinheimera marina]|uniref:GGDEF domain-containing protein n=1 Tax=Rheinheimera marina TaxID=1774958 RepID=A0ABV9JLB6_9GAMM